MKILKILVLMSLFLLSESLFAYGPLFTPPDIATNIYLDSKSNELITDANKDFVSKQSSDAIINSDIASKGFVNQAALDAKAHKKQLDDFYDELESDYETIESAEVAVSNKVSTLVNKNQDLDSYMLISGFDEDLVSKTNQMLTDSDFVKAKELEDLNDKIDYSANLVSFDVSLIATTEAKQSRGLLTFALSKYGWIDEEQKAINDAAYFDDDSINIDVDSNKIVITDAENGVAGRYMCSLSMYYSYSLPYYINLLKGAFWIAQDIDGCENDTGSCIKAEVSAQGESSGRTDLQSQVSSIVFNVEKNSTVSLSLFYENISGFPSVWVSSSRKSTMWSKLSCKQLSKSV